MTPLTPLGKSFRVRKWSSLQWQIHSFQNHILLERSFYHWQQMLSTAFTEVRGSFYLFLGNKFIIEYYRKLNIISCVIQ